MGLQPHIVVAHGESPDNRDQPEVLESCGTGVPGLEPVRRVSLVTGHVVDLRVTGAWALALAIAALA